MRKITRNAVDAFTSHSTFRSSNTEVYVTDDGEVHMRLHGNLIARSRNGVTHINTQGWSTPTTHERLNGLLSAYSLPRIAGLCTRAHESKVFMNGELVAYHEVADNDGWIEL